MNVDLTPKDIEFILGRFKNSEQTQDEELLVHKLRRHSEKREHFMRQYQQNFKKEIPLPPMPQESTAQETSPTFGETST